MKADCVLCMGGKSDPQVILAALGNNHYMVFCSNCQSLFISKKRIFSSTLKNQLKLSLTRLVEHLNLILDTNPDRLSDELSRNKIIPETVFEYLIKNDYLLKNNELGFDDKSGSLGFDILATSADAHRQACLEARIEQIAENRTKYSHTSDIDVIWESCPYG